MCGLSDPRYTSGQVWSVVLRLHHVTPLPPLRYRTGCGSFSSRDCCPDGERCCMAGDGVTNRSKFARSSHSPAQLPASENAI
ncbi:hypothetical protein J6590_014984 [Homalodisca vitripennis]|nr:hypothetical protein J6590_014984 [Homalodisca vitripennis]